MLASPKQKAEKKMSTLAEIRFFVGNLELVAAPTLSKSGAQVWSIRKFGKKFGTQNVLFSDCLGQNIVLACPSLTKEKVKLAKLVNTDKNQRMAAKLIVKVGGKPVALKLSIIASVDSNEAKLAVTATNVSTSNGKRGRAKTPTTTLANLFG